MSHYTIGQVLKTDAGASDRVSRGVIVRIAGVELLTKEDDYPRSPEDTHKYQLIAGFNGNPIKGWFRSYELRTVGVRVIAAMRINGLLID